MQLSWSPKPKSDFYKDHWIPYPQGEAVLDQLASLLSFPDSVRTPGLLIYGDSNSGKTMLAKKFKKDVDQWHSNEDPGATTSIVQMVETPPDKPTPKTIFRAILRELNAPAPNSYTSDRLLEQVIHLYQHNSIQMLIIDELHNIGTISHNEQVTFLNALKYLSNVANIRVVAIGVEEAYRILQLDQQLGSRFRPTHLLPWSVSDKEYAKFIIQLLRTAGFTPSKENMSKSFVQNIHDMTNGLTGETKDLIMAAAHFAQSLNTAEIGIELLQQLNWTPPLMRYR